MFISPLSFALGIVANFLCSSFFVVDVIVGLHAKDESMFNDFLIEKWKWISYVVKTYFIYGLWLCVII